MSVPWRIPIPDDRIIAISQELRKYEELEIAVKQLTGYNFESLKELFAMGYTLQPPEDDISLAEEAESIDKSGETEMNYDVSVYSPTKEAYCILVEALEKEETNMFELAAAIQRAVNLLEEALT